MPDPTPAVAGRGVSPRTLLLVTGESTTVLELKTTLGSTKMTRADEPEKWTYRQGGGSERYEYSDVYLSLTTVNNAPAFSIIELFLRPVPPGESTPTAQNSDRAQNGLLAVVNLYPGKKNHNILLPRVLTYRGQYVIDMRALGVTVGVGSTIKTRPVSAAVEG